MKKKMKVVVAVVLFLIIIPIRVFAHPGRTDSNGCHYCRTNCGRWGLGNGEYHCHGAASYSNTTTSVTPTTTRITTTTQEKVTTTITRTNKVIVLSTDEKNETDEDESGIGGLLITGALGFGVYSFIKKRKNKD